MKNKERNAIATTDGRIQNRSSFPKFNNAKFKLEVFKLKWSHLQIMNGDSY